MQKVLAAKALAAEIPKKAKSPGNSARRSPRHARAFCWSGFSRDFVGPEGPPTTSYVPFVHRNQQCLIQEQVVISPHDEKNYTLQMG